MSMKKTDRGNWRRQASVAHWKNNLILLVFARPIRAISRRWRAQFSRNRSGSAAREIAKSFSANTMKCGLKSKNVVATTEGPTLDALQLTANRPRKKRSTRFKKYLISGKTGTVAIVRCKLEFLILFKTM